jgi:hypothetical protein
MTRSSEILGDDSRDHGTGDEISDDAVSARSGTSGHVVMGFALTTSARTSSKDIEIEPEITADVGTECGPQSLRPTQKAHLTSAALRARQLATEPTRFPTIGGED